MCSGVWYLKMWRHVGNWWLKSSQKTLYINGKYGTNTDCHSETHTHTCTHARTHTQAICLEQDAASASFSWHLLEGKSGLEAVVWHQHSKSDTIYHQPPNMETFITSWQENLVENNHLGFDNNLAPSFTPHFECPVLTRYSLSVTFIHLSGIETAIINSARYFEACTLILPLSTTAFYWCFKVIVQPIWSSAIWGTYWLSAYYLQ